MSLTTSFCAFYVKPTFLATLPEMSYRLPSVSRILFFPQKLLKGADDKLALPLSQFQCGKCPAFKRIQAGSEIHTGQHEYYKNGMSSGPAPFPLPPRCSSALPDSLASAHPLFLFLLHSSNTPSTFFFFSTLFTCQYVSFSILNQPNLLHILSSLSSQSLQVLWCPASHTTD